jgi:hypothetical protein
VSAPQGAQACRGVSAPAISQRLPCEAVESKVQRSLRGPAPQLSAWARSAQDQAPHGPPMHIMLSVNCRLDNSSTLACRRIAANNSTFDLDSTPAPSKITDTVADYAGVGPNQTVTPAQPVAQVGPNQTVTPGPDQTVTANEGDADPEALGVLSVLLHRELSPHNRHSDSRSAGLRRNHWPSGRLLRGRGCQLIEQHPPRLPVRSGGDCR